MLLATRIIVIVGLMGPLSLQAAAQAAKPEVCFCLKRKSTGSTEHLGCKHKLPPLAITPEVSCINSETGSEYKPLSLGVFDEVAEGKDGCNPCIPLLTRGRALDHIRGPE